MMSCALDPPACALPLSLDCECKGTTNNHTFGGKYRGRTNPKIITRWESGLRMAVFRTPRKTDPAVHSPCAANSSAKRVPTATIWS